MGKMSIWFLSISSTNKGELAHTPKKNQKVVLKVSKVIGILKDIFHSFIGDGYLSLHQQFRIGPSTVGRIVYETCAAIYKGLQPIYLKVDSITNMF